MTAPPGSDTISGVKLYFAIFGASIVAAVACGARTGLDVPVPPELDAGPDVEDAGPDVVDAAPDVFDAAPDVVDAPPDAPPDAPIPYDCADAGVTYIYVITADNTLYSYYPPSGAFTSIGTIACPTASTDFPFSMAVDRQGIAYVVFQSGNLFRVSTADASCTATSYVPTTIGSAQTFGMGYSADVTDPGETLFVASDDVSVAMPTVPEWLGDIDTTSFQLDTLGQFPHVIGSAELTGTGDGRLFGFGVLNDDSVDGGPPTLRLVQFDKTAPGTLLSETFLTLPAAQTSITDWAFSFWGGDFYFFTATNGNGPSTVSLYKPGGPPIANPILSLSQPIVGAGVSTCAPQQ